MGYLIASNLEQALASMSDSKGNARVVAGATDLYLQKLPDQLIDITVIPETTKIEQIDGILTIGSTVTHTAAAGSPLVRSKATALAEACSLIGSPQLRNIGTVGGNVINAAPAADAAVALVALGANAVLINTAGEYREEKVEDLYKDHNLSLIDSSSEIMLRLIIETCVGDEGSAFVRFASRKALSLPLVNAAARVRIVEGRLKDILLVVAPVRPAPTRLLHTEEMLRGMSVSEETWRNAETSAAAEVDVRNSLLRCSAQYRRHLIGVLAGRALKKAAERAVGREEGDYR